LADYGAKVIALLKGKMFLMIMRYTTMDKDYSQNAKSTSTTSIAIIAIVAALGLLGVVVVTVVVTIPLQQEAEAGCERGGAPSTAVNASKGRCFHP
jgi:uncharacterized membrane protein YjgN (DUF898 family)